MHITLQLPIVVPTGALAAYLRNELSNTRFTFELDTVSYRTLKFRKIRLKQSKHYCGNHPGECPIQSLPTKHARRNYLEGADWVEWNDRINDALDQLKISANVRTSNCIVRKGTRRRVRYGAYMVGRFQQWNFDEFDDWFLDFIVDANQTYSRSWYPPGTPGLYERN